ncbi:unnamed protein product, partial [Arabidopsis halleri]
MFCFDGECSLVNVFSLSGITRLLVMLLVNLIQLGDGVSSLLHVVYHKLNLCNREWGLSF